MCNERPWAKREQLGEGGTSCGLREARDEFLQTTTKSGVRTTAWAPAGSTTQRTVPVPRTSKTRGKPSVRASTYSMNSFATEFLK